MKLITCGIALFNKKDQFLVCHPTGAQYDFWSIHKGIYDESDVTYENCAKRELKEETGIELKDGFELNEGLMYPYPHGERILKGFYGFLDVDIHELKCYSYVTSLKGIVPFPEVDAFTWANLRDANKILNIPTQQFIKDIVRKYKYGTKNHRIM